MSGQVPSADGGSRLERRCHDGDVRIYRRLWRRRLHPAETAVHVLLTFATYGLWWFVWRRRMWTRHPPVFRRR